MLSGGAHLKLYLAILPVAIWGLTFLLCFLWPGWVILVTTINDQVNDQAACVLESLSETGPS